MRPMHHFKPERCIDCSCCDADQMECRPNDPDCHERYDLDEGDLVNPKRCDFFIPKQASV